MTAKLTATEKKAMRLYHLGGIEAWRSNGNHIRCNTVNSLCNKGMFDSHGLTPKGKQYINEYVRR